MYVKRKMFVDIVLFSKCSYIEPCGCRLAMRQKHLCDFSDPYDNFKIRALKLMSFEGVLPLTYMQLKTIVRALLLQVELFAQSRTEDSKSFEMCYIPMYLIFTASTHIKLIFFRWCACFIVHDPWHAIKENVPCTTITIDIENHTNS